MSVQVLAARDVNRVRAGAGSSLALSLDDQDAGSRWTIDVYALLPDIAGPRWCGRITTTAYAASGQASRVVLIATVPGAVGWECSLRRFAGPADTAATVETSVSSAVGGPPGVFAL